MTTAVTLKVKDQLFMRLNDLESSCLRIKRGDNRGPYLGRVFVWQEVLSFAKDRLKRAWEETVAEDIMDSDDALREGGVGEERIAIESDQFSVVVKVDKPRLTFSRDKFIAAVAKRYKLDPAQLEVIAKGCMSESVPPLHKRVLEA